MKRLTFALVCTAALGTSACNSGNQDQVNNAEMNQAGVEDLNNLADEAANTAESDTLANQQAQLNQENADNMTSPDDEQEQNVSGM